MKRRDYLKWLGGTAVCAVALNVHATAKKPNILFIFSDDHAIRTIGAYGSGLHKTPNIDRIAAEGAVFMNSFCCNSICQPSRAAILTGKHSHLNGVTDNGRPWDGSQKIFPRELKKAGYQTMLRGKWHMHPVPENGEFDSWEVLSGAGGQGHYYNPEFTNEKGTVIRKGYETDVTTDQTIEWLEKERDPKRPFLVMCQFKAPHVPRMPALRYLDRYKDVEFEEPETLFDDYKTREHAAKAWMMLGKQKGHILNIFPEKNPLKGLNKGAMSYFDRMDPDVREAYIAAYAEENAEYFKNKNKLKVGTKEGTKYRYQRFIKDYLRIVDGIDDNVGRLLQWLEDNNLADNTIVIYSSDQSYFTGEHGYAEKRWMYEESLRMPFVIRWPGVITPGSRPEALIQNIDYAPTFLEAAGLVPPREMQGRSLMPVLQGKTPEDWRKSIYYHYYAHGKHNVPRHDGVRSGRYKLIHLYTDDTFELFDLKNDPNELKNVFNDPEYKSVRMRMEKELARQRKAYQVPEKAFEKPYM
jgi:N-acetylglucosamine-6-sulfatase